ncbi:MAG: N-acetyl-gamma-glutamyl-phosphate reductase [Bacteroidota bacterium]|nr:N-acetyl-gamma-glutamyl-phosphate reductase [Bacteroidota bacterium]
MKNKIRIGIIGGAGYTGGELIRLLINHPSAEVLFIHSKSNAGKELHTVHQDLVGETKMQFSQEIDNNIDVLFLCVGHGDSLKFMEENDIPAHIKIISLSQDFRLKGKSVFNTRKFIYGLPEINREKIKSAENIANPGCFATSIELGLLPLAKMNLLGDVFTTGITGSTGAGQSPSATSHFSWRENNVQAYKSLTHQHLTEINESLNSVSDKPTSSIHFVPWRGDFTRGIFITSQIKCTGNLHDFYEVFEEFYKDHPFVKISRQPIFLKQVVNTNNCFINLEKVDDILVVHSEIDNLLKGASGQAVQNMNLMFGIEETEGLKLKANYF